VEKGKKGHLVHQWACFPSSARRAASLPLSPSWFDKSRQLKLYLSKPNYHFVKYFF
jgi:hypothetical protein